MKRVFLTIVLAVATMVSFAQPATSNNRKPETSKDSIPPLYDSVAFITNADLVQFIKILKIVMTHPDYTKAGDAISQYEMIIANTNQVFIAARQRWEQKNKIKR